MLYILLGGVLIAGLSVLIALLIRRSNKNKKREKVLSEVIEQDPELEIMRDMDKSATDIVKEFWWYIKSPESPYNRRQRRMIQRHFKKFLFAWHDLSTKQQDIGRIVSFLAGGPHNSHVLTKYREIVSGLPTKSESDV